jgi:hypothetical protein
MVKDRALYYSKRRKSDVLVLRNREQTSNLWSGWMLRRLVESIFRKIQSDQPDFRFPEDRRLTGSSVSFYDRLWTHFTSNVPVGAVNVPTLIADWKHIDVYARYLHVGQVGTNGNYVYGSGIISTVPLKRGWYDFYLSTLSNTSRHFVEYYRNKRSFSDISEDGNAEETRSVSRPSADELESYILALPPFAVNDECALPCREAAWVSNLD